MAKAGTILKLKLPTDPLWVKNVVESNIEEILIDHAFCEQKAATNAITIIVHNPNLSDLVNEMALLAQEEMEHFKRVHDIILARGYVLGKERRDHYVNELFQFLVKGGSREQQLVDRLLFSTMIEARSCERFLYVVHLTCRKRRSERQCHCATGRHSNHRVLPGCCVARRLQGHS